MLRSRVMTSVVGVLVWLAGAAQAGQDGVSVSFSRPALSLAASGRVSASLENLPLLSRPGYPALPYKTIVLSCRPGLTPANVDIVPSEGQVLVRSVMPVLAPPISAMNARRQAVEEAVGIYHDNRLAFEAQGAVYPARHYDVHVSGMELIIRLYPLQFDADGGQLIYTPSFDVEVDGQPLSQTRAVQPMEKQSQMQPVALLIVSADGLEESVQAFIHWKQNLGYDVEMVSASEVKSLCNDAEHFLLRFLQREENMQRFTHLLIIGDESIVPFDALMPNRRNPLAYFAIPSDLCLTSPSMTWDADEDGQWGEWEDDISGWVPEISVGRIPFSDAESVRRVLSHAMDFEMSQGKWKERGLLMGGMCNYPVSDGMGGRFEKTDGAALMSMLSRDFFEENADVLAEGAGIAPSAIAHDGGLDRSTVDGALAADESGAICWWAHGTPDAMERLLWERENGNGLAEQSELGWAECLSRSNIPSFHQTSPVVFANACDNGWPEKNNLAESFLMQGSAGVVAASRESYYVMGWDSVDAGGNATLAYFFWEAFHRDGLMLGDALNQAKSRYISRFSDAWQQWQNVVAFHCFGDPTLKRQPALQTQGAMYGRWPLDEAEPAELKLNDGQNSMLLEVDGRGHFREPGLSAGAYQLRARAQGGSEVVIDVQIAEGAVAEVDLSGHFKSSQTAVPEAAQELTLAIEGNYPNPFNQHTTVSVSLDRPGLTLMGVYNVLGQPIRRLFCQDMVPGNYNHQWDGKNDAGLEVASGIYFVVLEHDSRRLIHRMLYIK